jgi:hypothetical protein
MKPGMPVSLQAVLSVLLFAVVLTVLNYPRGRQMVNSASSVLFEHIERDMALQIDGLYRPIGQLMDRASAASPRPQR